MPEVRLREVRDEDLPFIYEQQRDPVYAEHWAGHRPVEVTIEEDQIVIRRSGGEEDDDD